MLMRWFSRLWPKATLVAFSAVTPVRLAIGILAIVFTVEWAIMVILAAIFPHGLPTYTGAALDSCLLTMAIAPAIWVIVVRPLRADAQHLAHLNRKLNSVLSQREVVEQRLRHLADYDSLTGLPNRSFCMKQLEKAVRRLRARGGYRFAILFVELDGLKFVNDNFGHAGGDALLIAAAQRLQGSVRGEDLVARWGGDEFMLVLGDADERAASSVAQRIVAKLAAAFPIRSSTADMPQTHDVHVSCSIGICGSSADYASSEQVLRSADIAMGAAKKAGRGQIVIFEAAMDTDKMPSQAGGNLRPAAHPLASES